ncbi:DUF3846 domain-containing protein (plasmid) [Brucella pituitosa]|uniref:DUF3846 domain-containing protein n=1 Tax=Brucella pituitosa TaxID=571256 RepID=UPI00163BD746|nr:protein psiB [Ochrobactrum sp. CM-21-5]MBC2887692.1 protein psiB [Ochrobactrum sp. CM-21-5]
MNQTAYLLDPETTLFRPVTVPLGQGFKPFYELIGCRTIEVVRFDERHTLLVDEDGLQDGLTAFTWFTSYPQPLAGKLVLIGGDASVPPSDPLISIQDAAKHFICCRPVLNPIFASGDEIGQGGIIMSGALKGLQARIERRAPTVVEGAA